jgi:hypothetical protein
MAAGVLLAQGNLPVAANKLQRGGVGCDNHVSSELVSRDAADPAATAARLAG